MSTHLGRSNLLYKFVRSIACICLHLFYNLKIEGQEKIPAHGPVIILPKHQFWTDIPLVSLAVPRPLNYIAKKELFIYPLIRHFLIALGGIPLDRQNPLKTINSLRYIEKLLKEKEFIVIFPEGTYYPYSMGRGKHRLIQHILHLQKKIPFIPMGLNYSPGWWRPKVKIKIGDPVYAPQEILAKVFTEALINEIAHLSGIEEPRSNVAERKEEDSGEPSCAVANQG